MHPITNWGNRLAAGRIPAFRRPGRGLATLAVMLMASMLLPGACASANTPGAVEPTGGNGFIRGSVTDTTAAALSGVTIQIRLQSDDSLVAQTSTDSSGEFGPTEVAPDSYIVEATKQFYISSSRNVTVGTNETQIVNLVLERGSGFLDGDVTDEDGVPIAGASVVVVDLEDGSVAAQLTSGSGGSFGPEELPAANYTVTVDHPDYVAFSTPIILEVNESEAVFAVLLGDLIFQSRFEAGN